MTSIFLTSSPTGPLDGSRPVDGLDAKNHFREELRWRWRQRTEAKGCGLDCLMITAFPADIPASEEMTAFFRGVLEKEGFSYGRFDLLDDRWGQITAEELGSYDCIWLGGGHVPTQNAFFWRLGLREKLIGFDGIIIGISAGSMNSADWVYAEPEEEGEAIDPAYIRWLQGLNLTRTMLLPHYQMVRCKVLDGLRLYEDIVYKDSYGNEILNLPDGSYLLCENGEERIFGEAWLIKDGVNRQICADGQVLHWR